jgi:hypothetical protein
MGYRNEYFLIQSPLEARLWIRSRRARLRIAIFLSLANPQLVLCRSGHFLLYLRNKGVAKNFTGDNTLSKEYSTHVEWNFNPCSKNPQLGQWPGYELFDLFFRLFAKFEFGR